MILVGNRKVRREGERLRSPYPYRLWGSMTAVGARPGVPVFAGTPARAPVGRASPAPTKHVGLRLGRAMLHFP